MDLSVRHSLDSVLREIKLNITDQRRRNMKFNLKEIKIDPLDEENFRKTLRKEMTFYGFLLACSLCAIFYGIWVVKNGWNVGGGADFSLQPDWIHDYDQFQPVYEWRILHYLPKGWNVPRFAWIKYVIWEYCWQNYVCSGKSEYYLIILWYHVLILVIFT